MEGSFVGVNYQGENDNYITSNSNNQGVDEQQLNLPPGFRFHPTDEEIIIHYLIHKVFNSNFTATAIGEVDLNRCEPWDLPKKAKMGEKEWYFFCQRDRKYPTGMRTNRATESGYWKATGKDKEIYNKPAAGKGGGGSSRDGGGKQLVGMKKTLVFYKGRAPKGEKSDWVMHEFRLEGNFSYYKLPKSAKDEWVVCRVIHKNAMILKPSPTIDLTRMNSFVEGLLDSPSLPPLLDAAFFNTNERANVSSSTNTGISSCNVQDFKETSLANKYPITTTLSPDGKTIYYHQLQMQPQTYSTSTTIFDPISTNYQIPNSLFYSQNPYELHQQKFDHLIIPNFPRPDNVKQNTNQALHERQCKVEQLSSNNQSMVSPSPDTGLSADITTDNASSKQEENREKRRRLNDIDEDNGPFSDLDSFWSY